MKYPDDFEIKQCHEMVLTRDALREYFEKDKQQTEEFLKWLRGEKNVTTETE